MTISLVVGLVVLVALAVLGTRKLLPSLLARRTAPTPEERALAAATESLDQACSAFKKRIKDARSVVSSTQRTHAKAVSVAEKRVEQAQKIPYFGHAGGIKVYEDRIATPEGVHPMDEHVKGTVDDAGVIAVTRRHTVTRFALLGPLSLFTPKSTKHDNRELYFLVEHPEWASLVKLNPNAGMAARKVCANLNVVARQASANRTARAKMIATANQELAGVSADRRRIDEAEQSLGLETASFSEVEDQRRYMEARIAPCSDNSRFVKRAIKMVARAEELRSG